MKLSILSFLSIISIVFSFCYGIASQRSCLEYESVLSEYSLEKFNYEPENVDGRSYPSHSRVLFRGIYDSNDQFDLRSVLVAIFESKKKIYIGSPLFRGISDILIGKRKLNERFLPNGKLPNTMQSYLSDRGIYTDILELINCRGKTVYSREEADLLASRVLNKYFFRMNESNLAEKYFDMSWKAYYDNETNSSGYGNNAIEFVPASTYDYIASIYGRKIIVFKDTRQRAIDLTFYNYKKNGFYVHSWVDLGETNSPGYITSDEIIGYQERLNDRIRGKLWYASTPDNPIIYAVYREQINDRNIALVYTGNGVDQCLIQGMDRKFYLCKNISPSMTNIPISFPEVSRLPAKLIGIITNRNIDDDIDILRQALTQFGDSTSRDIPPQFLKSFMSANDNGQLYFHSVESILKASKNY